MAETLNGSLYGVERQSLEVLRLEYQRYIDTGKLTPQFVQLMKNTHEMLMKGARQRAGVDISSKSPREILVELHQLQAEFQAMVDLEEQMADQGQLQ